MEIDGKSLSMEGAAQVIFGHENVSLAASARENIRKGREVIAQCLQRDVPVYGINTGFGKLADVRISRDHLNDLQERLVVSHATGVGQPLSPPEVRAVLLLKANTLAKGYSGVREEVVDLLLAMLNAGILPVIPEKGSVGASGDLAPLAHMALALIGKGEVFYRGKRMPAAQALKGSGLKPLSLRAKEGLALINGTQFMTGVGFVNWHTARRLLLSADLIAALSTEGLMGTPVAFDERIQEARGYRGQVECARRLRAMMQGSEIREAHRDCGRVQDPYSIRCVPQVHGAIRDNLEHTGAILQTEMNAATDNPLVFSDTGEILSGGNFHGHPVATAMDLLGIIMAQLANMSERRIALMMDSHLSSLPPFLVHESGLNSGFMIAQVTAASLVSENKTLSHPASVDSIPTSANKEDYVTMGAAAAVKCREIIRNCLHVLAIELLCACQCLDLRAPLKPGPAGAALLHCVRQSVRFLESDRELGEDIARAVSLIESGALIEVAEPFLDQHIL